MKYTLKATIPTGSYANIQPEITVDAESLHEAEQMLMPYMHSMFERYSDAKLKVSGTVEKLKSFNEDVEVDFDRVNHTYTYQGKRLESASGFVKRHTKEFDKEAIGARCATNWGVEKQEVLDLWESNGTVASDFGTTIHAALEHYFKYRTLGQTIFEKSKKEQNAALPNHPLLKRIILELEELDTIDGIEKQEVLVSNVSKGYCGLVDKLKIIGEKECRVQDYKIAFDIEKPGEKLLEPFEKLSPTKLSKYQIQLSFYATLLSMSGWKVQGLDIFAYDGNWSRHKLEVLPLNI